MHGNAQKHTSALASGIVERNVQARETIEQRAPSNPQFTGSAGSIAPVLVQAINQKYAFHPLHPLA